MSAFTRSRRVTLSATVLATSLTLASRRDGASANSMVTHIWVAEQAADRIEPGALRDIIGDPRLRSVLQNGAIYPDSGYSVHHAYGEWAHWESFHEPYLQWIRARWGAEGYRSPDARRHVAFLMGCAAHGMTDQTFDQYFMERARQYDRTRADTLDVGSDAWLVVEHNVTSQADGAFWFDEMPMIHAAVGGPAVTPALLREAAVVTSNATRFLVQYGYTLYDVRWRELPWAASHYMDPDTPGSYPRLVEATAAYYRFLWRRLQGDAPSDAPPLYSWPAPGQTNYPVDHADIESRVVVTTAWGLDDATVSATSVRVVGPGEVAVPARTWRYGPHGNTLMIRPLDDLAFDAAYRVELAGSIRTLAGSALGRTLTIPFHTRCAPDRLADCPPLPTPRPTLTEPPVRNPQPPVGMKVDAGPIVMVDDAGRPATLPMSRPPAPREDAACGCRATRPASRAAWTWGGLAWVALYARRRRSRSSA